MGCDGNECGGASKVWGWIVVQGAEGVAAKA